MDKKKILVVEDEEQIRMMLAEDLQGAGYEVFQAGNGAEALEVLLKDVPHLIITDVLMPKMNGSDLMKQVHAIPEFKGIPFIILTARGLMRDYFETLKVSAFIDKPFVTDNVLAKVAEILKNVRIEKPAVVEPPQAKPVENKMAASFKKVATTAESGKSCNQCGNAVPANVSVCSKCGSTDMRWEETNS